MTKRKWIKDAVSKKKSGALSRQLGIPIEDDIPMNLLEHIKSSPVGNTLIYNYKKIKVTKKLKQRANLALNLKRISQR